ncbi:MAG: DUF1080 domain-containing protein [Planctomycetota bacterium]
MPSRSNNVGLMCGFVLLAIGIRAQPLDAVEYLPGIAWPEPAVITPGENNADAPSDAIVLFDGKDLSAWNDDGSWQVENGVMIVGTTSLLTKRKFGDCQVHVEWSMPNPPRGNGQDRGNSGIFFMPHYEEARQLYWKYEIQILDSYDNRTYFDGQAAAVYKQSPPLVNAMRRPGQWNTYDIVFIAPRFAEDGTLNSPAYVTLVHNGVLVHNHYEMSGPTSWTAPPAYSKHAERLPLGLQNHGHKVRFRNIWVREITPIVGEPASAPMLRKGNKRWPVGAKEPAGAGE